MNGLVDGDQIDNQLFFSEISYAEIVFYVAPKGISSKSRSVPKIASWQGLLRVRYREIGAKGVGHRLYLLVKYSIDPSR
jgi:hypothetical protein